MPNETHLKSAQYTHPYTYESIVENDLAYLFEDHDETLDQFDDNDF